MSTMLSFEHIINNDKDEIINFINLMDDKNKDNVARLKTIIKNSSFSYKYEVLSVPDNVFLKNVLMCLVYSSLDPYLANTSIMEKYREKIELACHELGLNTNNVVPLCTIEKELISALKL
jgi:hypothetical protein